MVAHAIIAFGTDAQKDFFLPRILTGEVFFCQGYSEPEAGSDLASVRTRGVRDGDTWRLSGQKIWTSNARFADLGLALVRTDPDAPKHRGLTAFLVPMRQSTVEVRAIRQLTGGTSFCEVFLDGAEVPDAMRLGDEGAGWQVARSAVATERQDASDRSHELLARAQRLLTTLAERTGRGDDPLVRDDLARLHVRLRVARLHQLRTQASGSGELTQASGTIDKLLVAANLRDAGALAAELLGPAFAADTGEWGTFGWTKWMLGALGYRIAGGTEEVLKTMLAERILGLPREER
jgi:alkylation response protein AidB-like acyl-CoA dehydrogenase